MTNLMRIRKSKGLTRRELSYLANVSYDVLSSYELGRRDIDKAELATALRLCQALSCNPYELIEDVEKLL